MIKSLRKDSGQNPIEAAKLDCKIYHGPFIYNFEDIYQILEQNNISQKINSFEELSKNLEIDLKDFKKTQSDNKVFINRLGQKTLKDTMELIKTFLNNENQ